MKLKKLFATSAVALTLAGAAAPIFAEETTTTPSAPTTENVPSSTVTNTEKDQVTGAAYVEENNKLHEANPDAVPVYEEVKDENGKTVKVQVGTVESTELDKDGNPIKLKEGDGKIETVVKEEAKPAAVKTPVGQKTLPKTSAVK